jgi:hypothetical protein
MKILRAILKGFVGFLITAVVLLGLVLGGLYYLLNRPEFTFPEKTLRWVAANILEPMDIIVTFKTLEARLVQTSESDWYERQLIVSAEELDVTMPDFLKTHIPFLDLELVMDLHPQRLDLKRIGPIDLAEVSFAMKLDRPDPRKKSEPFDTKAWMQRLRDVKIEPIHVGLESLLIERPDGLKIVSPALDATLEQDSESDPYLSRLVVSGEGLDVVVPDLLSLYLPNLDLQLLVNHHPDHYGLKVLGPISVQDASVAVQLEKPNPRKKSEPLDIKALFQPFRETRVEPIRLSLKTLTVQRPDGLKVVSLRMEASLAQEPGNDPFLDRLVVTGEELDVIVPELLKTHVPGLEAQVLLNHHPDNYGIKGLGPVAISNARLALKLAKEDPKKVRKKAKEKAAEPFNYEPWLDRLRQMKFEPMRIDLKSLVVERPGEPTIEGQLLAKLQRQPGNKWNFSVRADRVKGLPARKANFDLNVDLPEGPDLLPLAANVKGRADLGKFGSAQLSGDGRMEAEDVGQVRLNLNSSFEGKRQEMKASGSLNKEKFALTVSGSAARPVDMLQKVELNGCAWNGDIRRKGKPFLQSNLNCRVALTRMPAPEERPFQDMLPKHFQFLVQGPVTIANWDKSPVFEAPMKISLTPLLSEFYTLRGQTSINFSGKFLEGKESLNAEIDVSSQLVFQRFQPIVKKFQDTDFSIPAPFNTLDGRIYCNIEGRIQKMGAMMNLPLDCGTDLSSATQAMYIKAQGTFEKTTDQKLVIRLAIGLNKLTFELPKLALNGTVPQIFPDKRIMTAKERAKADGKTDDALPVTLDIHITTPPERPLTLITSLQPTPVPISIDLTLKGDRVDPLGSIGINQYRVSFLKKKAFVDHIRLILAPDEKQPLLDGLVVFQDPDVKINLKLSGSVDQPFYELESMPPRSPAELLSIVLYGGDPDALDEENLRSVDETRAAMVDGAIGLLSMYYLASTPIDSVGYNPYTGLFRARVRVAQGLSLTVGSDLGGARQSLTLRKRLTENWSFETGAETDEETHQSKGVAMFKWGRRY